MQPDVKPALDWFENKGWQPFAFQREAWAAYQQGFSGLVNAPTGSGKTYSLLLPILLEGMAHPAAKKAGPLAIWITPIRALSKEIHISAMRAIEGLGANLTVGIRTGDTSVRERTRQQERPPDLLITTPESLHLMLAQKKYPQFFARLSAVVVDEWHELMGSKRGVQMELALSRLKVITPALRVWGISATIGNLDQAAEVLLGVPLPEKRVTIRANIQKPIAIHSILPDEVETLPWAGHLGIQLLQKVVPIIKASNSTLIFTNTRSFAEIWYQKLLNEAPELAGLIAMHHGSISQELRTWVEEQLYEGKLKAVVCTSSLDLGVDFRPVETIIQVGSPKGVARFLQRAGRSGHQPGAVSRIYFLPTHSLELTEAAALREAIHRQVVEERIPYVRSFDVLVQYLVTLAVSEGFRPADLLREVRSTFSFSSISDDEWNWTLQFVTTGGAALTAYNEYRKVVVENGVYRVDNKRTAFRHRLSIGTIVGEQSMQVKMMTGKFLGSIEEYFVSSLHPGDVFWFAGRTLEFVRLKDMDVLVRKSKRKSGKVPSWQGGRMPLSSQMSALIREKIDEASRQAERDPEMQFIQPLMALQRERSHLPAMNEFLVEYLESSEGYHVMMYPFEGRQVHEGLAALVAHRIARTHPITFSIAMNDYGFELLSDQPIPIEEAIETNVLGSEDLLKDIQASINSTEMARRKFRDIASIAGLVFKGFPGQRVRDRHLQSNSQLFFDVFHDYESHNLLLLQAYEEVMDFQLEEVRLRAALERIRHQKIVITYPEKPTPFGFPIMVDRLSRDKLTSERLEDRVKKMMVMWGDEKN
ncbi:MAG: ligase-associated DNA damage response DEXH box helicase [Cyclobacteriaceae bacterium]